MTVSSRLLCLLGVLAGCAIACSNDSDDGTPGDGGGAGGEGGGMGGRPEEDAGDGAGGQPASGGRSGSGGASSGGGRTGSGGAPGAGGTSGACDPGSHVCTKQGLEGDCCDYCDLMMEECSERFSEGRESCMTYCESLTIDKLCCQLPYARLGFDHCNHAMGEDGVCE